MRISLFTIGARGDTQPFVALAVKLRQAGHSVTLAARPDFAGLAADYGVEFAPPGHPYQPFITGAARASALGAGHLLNQLRYGLYHERYVSDQLNQDAWRAAQDEEAIIYKYNWITAYSLAEKLGVPCAAAKPFPPTRAFPRFVFGRGIDRGPLARQQREEMPVFFAYSSAVLPRPVDWPERMQVTGYWFLDPPPGWPPPAELLRFLQAGPLPVSIGFGSMASRDAEAALDLVLKALALSGQRGVLLSGWAGLGEGRTPPKHVFGAESLPHSRLFPRRAAIVHHGGAGTTGAALCSGVPSVLVPLAADQPSWARQVHALGVGPAPLSFQTLTAERLAGAIREAMTSPSMRQRAAELGRRIQAEDGLGRTIELFLQYVDRKCRRR